MKHYICTNRKVRTDKNGNDYIIKDGYEPPSTEIRFGTVDSNNGEIDIFEDINVSLNQNGDVNYADSTLKNKGSFKLFKQLEEFLSKESNELIIFIPGYGNDTKNIQQFTKDLHSCYIEDQSENRRFLTFFWTTNGKKLSPKDYKLDSYDSTFAGRALAKLFIRWAEYLEIAQNYEQRVVELKGKIHLMAQSMGNQVLKHTMEFINYVEEKPLSIHFNEILLLAADVEKQVFKTGNAFETLPLLGNRIHVFGQKKDTALKLSNVMWLFMDKKLRIRLGQGFGKSEIAPEVENLYAVDVSELTRSEIIFHVDEIVEHWYFIKSKGVISEINKVLKGGRCNKYKN